MANFETAVAAALTTATAPAHQDEALAILWEAQGEEAPPASEERPSLHLVTPPPAVTEAEPETAPDVAPLARTCTKCGAQVANLPGVWNEQHGCCRVCAAPQLRKEQAEARKQAKTCACGNWKRPDHPLCRDCYEKQSAAKEQEAVTCPKCGKEKERHHRVCGECYRASLPQRPAPAARPAPKGKSNGRPEAPTYKVDPKAQGKAAARAKLAQSLLSALRAGELDKSFPGAKVTKDDLANPMVCIAYKGESYTMHDSWKDALIKKARSAVAQATQVAQAEAARKAAEARKAAAALAKANKSSAPKKGKKDKSGDKPDTKSGGKSKKGK